jgi:hypothetical protein
LREVKSEHNGHNHTLVVIDGSEYLVEDVGGEWQRIHPPSDPKGA